MKKKIPVVEGREIQTQQQVRRPLVLGVCLGAANFNKVVALKAKARNSRHPPGTSAALLSPTKGLQVLRGYCCNTVKLQGKKRNKMLL